MGNKKASGMIHEDRYLPTKRDGITGEVPPIPLKSKVRPAGCGKEDVIISRFIIAHSLIRVLRERENDKNNDKRKRPIIHPQIQKPIVFTKSRL